MFEATQSVPLKMVITSIPVIGGALDVLLTDGVRQLREEREKEFFDELSSGKIQITDDLARNHEFVHCFLVSARAALRSHQREKIRMFARMLSSSAMDGSASTIDDFEELTGILDDISLREWQALVILDQEMSKYDQELDNRDAIKVARDRLCDELNVPTSEIDAFVNRLERSGLYMKGSSTMDGGHLWGNVTATFVRLRKMVEQQAGE